MKLNRRLGIPARHYATWTTDELKAALRSSDVDANRAIQEELAKRIARGRRRD